MSLAVGYARVSTRGQLEGVSLDTQQKQISDYAKYRRLSLLRVYTDAGFSGSTLHRPALLEMLQNLSPGMYVIVTDLSRLSRSTRDSLTLLDDIKKKGAFLVCLNPDLDFSSPFGQMMFTILMSFHQLEREQTANNVKNTFGALHRKKGIRSKPPFGYRLVSRSEPYAPDEEQQAVLNIIKRLFTDEKMNYNKIARYLNENGYNKCLNRKDGDNKIFYAQTIKNILAENGLISGVSRKPISSRLIDPSYPSKLSSPESLNPPQNSSPHP